MRKIIFLDIDGVLNTESFQKTLQLNGWNNSDKYGFLFDPNAVECLKQIIEQTSAQIVISSSWKFLGKSALDKMWEERKLPGEIIGLTSSDVTDEWLLSADIASLDKIGVHPKSIEIEAWLKAHFSKIKSYVIIDDEPIASNSLSKFFVQTNPNIGLCQEDIDKTIKILNNYK